MKILIETPTWLGDAVMTTPAIENLTKAYPDATITLFGSKVAIDALSNHPKVTKSVIDTSKSSGNRLANIYHLSKELGKHDLAISFRSHIFSKILLYLTGSNKKYIYKKLKYKTPKHQVERYNDFISSITRYYQEPNRLKLYHTPYRYTKPTLGINPGATYGSAKRWYPDKFAKTAIEFANEYDIVIFGSPAEVNIANEIYEYLHKMGAKNIKNMAGKTTIPQLCSMIGGLSLFITADSGPMHIAAAYSVPTLSIFGPTKHLETSQWKNPNSILLRKDLTCAPCMKRTCPLHTHECMKSISPNEAIEALRKLR